MDDAGDVPRAAHALATATGPQADYSGPFVIAIGAHHAAVSTLGEPLGSEVISVTDRRAASLAATELDLGEGPGWEALRGRRPVSNPDIATRRSTIWPLAWQAFHEAGVGAVHSFPLVVSGIDVGAVNLFWDTPSALTDRQCGDAALLARIVARQVLHRAVLAAERQEEDAGVPDRDFSRREVHQATGMVLAQMGISPGDALMVIRGHAFATGRPVLDVARDIIDRTLDFTPLID